MTEADAPLVAVGCEATLRIPSSPGDIAGKVSRTSRMLHPTTRTLRAEIDLANPDGKLRPGMYVTAILKVAERPDVLSLPRTAVLLKDQKAACLTVGTDQKIVRTPITLGIRSGEEFEIVPGLTGNEWVIPSNVAAYREGQTVEMSAPR